MKIIKNARGVAGGIGGGCLRALRIVIMLCVQANIPGISRNIINLTILLEEFLL